MERMKELIELLNKAAREYYQFANEIMTDRKYDDLYDELVALEAETGIVLANSPTQNVGYTVLSNLQKVHHESRMLSLDKTKDIEKLKSFLGDMEAVLSWKLDGLTIVLTYRQGELFQAVTRGNGEIGEDITHNARVFANLPLKISFSGELVIRGEGIIPFSEFKKINDELPDDEKYKNPRNLCSGTVRQLNSEVAAKRNVQFFAFTLVRAEGQDFHDLKTNQIQWLSELGFTVVEHQVVTKDTVETAVKAFETKIEENDFASDGLVLTYNNISYGASLGNTSKFPKDSIAFKWSDEMAETTLQKIDWNTSRTGLINPIAVFDPVELEGSTVNRASVHNVSILEELALGIGDTIKVYKANMIIPQIAENLTKSGNVPIPETCPVCGGETEIRKLREGKALYCTNPTCKAQQVQALTHFVSKNAMNIEGLSEETIKKFVEAEWIKYYPDIYRLARYEEQIKNMEGFGERSYTKLMESIERSKNPELFNFLYALGINHVGLSNAKLICSQFKNSLPRMMVAQEEELIAIDGIGGIIAHSFYQYFQKEENKKLIDEVLQYVTIKEHKEKPEGEQHISLSGLTFVITGDVEKFKNRRELQDKIEALGGKATGSVTSKTSYLINNDPFSNSSKNKKAKELNIPIITEDQFIEQFLEDN